MKKFDRRKIVNKVRKLRDKGLSYPEIAVRFNEAGMRTATGLLYTLPRLYNMVASHEWFYEDRSPKFSKLAKKRVYKYQDKTIIYHTPEDVLKRKKHSEDVFKRIVHLRDNKGLTFKEITSLFKKEGYKSQFGKPFTRLALSHRYYKGKIIREANGIK